MSSIPPTLDDVFHIPEQVSALGYVVQLTDGAEAEQALVRDYVITPGVEAELPHMFDRLRTALHTRREDLGWFVHGSFGSGKSHFMSFLGSLLEDEDFAWAKDHPLVPTLAAEHRGWIGEARPLVVRENMLNADRPGYGFDRIVYAAVNKALERQGHAIFQPLNVDAIIDEIRQEAERYGDKFWAEMAEAQVVDSLEEFEAAVEDHAEDREALARQYVEAYRKSDPATYGLTPGWTEGMRRLAQHVRDAGYGGLVLLLDEMLLWLSGLEGHEYKRALNQLNVIVDHTDGARAVPTAVFVARQRRFSDFFPDMVDQEQIHDHLDHHGGRFETFTLEDVELRHIVRERVLRPKPQGQAALNRTLDELADRHSKVLPAILQNADAKYLRDVYPFHPALIEMLIDLSALMQRDRTALRMLNQLLVENRDLPLGEFLPVGRAFEAIFPGETIDVGERRKEQLRAIRTTYYQRIRPTIERMASESDGLTPPRKAALDAMVKTALLAAASNRLKGAGLTVERLVRLNEFEVTGEIDRGRISTAYSDLVTLSRHVPAVTISGEGATAEVAIKLEGADFGEVFRQARAQVNVAPRRFRAFHRVFQNMLGIAGRSGFGTGATNEGPFEVTWRGTRRRGTLVIANLRELPYEQFRVREGEFRLIVDYPWDDEGQGVHADQQRVQAVRKAEGTSYTMCWLPEHLTPQQMDELLDLAAADFLLEPGADQLLDRLAADDRALVRDLANQRKRTLTATFEKTLRKVYQDQGEALALVADVPNTVPHPSLDDNLDHFARELLDRRYPQHPRFGEEPRPAVLQRLLDWMVEAAEAHDGSAGVDELSEGPLRTIGEPLELVSIGQSRARLVQDRRYLADVLTRVDGERVSWGPIDLHLRETYGFPAAVRNLFLLFVARSRSYRILREDGDDPVDLSLDARSHDGLRLQRARLLDTAAWGRALELGRALLGLPDPPRQRTLAAQDRWAVAWREAGGPRRRTLQRLHARLTKLGLSHEADRLSEIRAALERLAPVDESGNDAHAMLEALLAAWPDQRNDPLRGLVAEAEATLAAADIVDDSDLRTLRDAAAQDRRPEVTAGHVAQLEALLGAGTAERTVSKEVVATWNQRAAEVINELVLDKLPPPPPPPPLPPGWKEEVLAEAAELPAGDTSSQRQELVKRLAERLEALAGHEVALTIRLRHRAPDSAATETGTATETGAAAGRHAKHGGTM